MRSLIMFLAGAVLGISVFWGGQQILAAHHAAHPYAGQEARAISSLSASDQAALLAGEGWGLAKPAEFNGFPGPAHVLELAADLDLTDTQRDAVEAAFAAMQAEAQTLGARLIEAEAALDAVFASGPPSETALRARLVDAEAVRAQLRAAHLSAHLTVTPILDDAQRAKYARLRGYSNQHSHSGH